MIEKRSLLSSARRVCWAGSLLSTLCLMSAAAHAKSAVSGCERQCMTDMVDQVLASMVTHNPYALPLARSYMATENSHPAALGMMTLWLSVTKTGKPDLLAIDTSAGQAFFEMQISEAGDLSMLWGRLKVVDHKISELEFFINRSRGDHGFSFSAENAPANLKRWMNPPQNRVKTSRAELEKLSRAAFDTAVPYKIDVDPDCQFLEAGSQIFDTGPSDGPKHPDLNKPLGCIFPPFRPVDKKAREIVIDEDLGIVVDAGMVRGHVYPSLFDGHMVSEFIPDDIKAAQADQKMWIDKQLEKPGEPLLQPMPATGVSIQVLQVYNGKLQGSQINVHLVGPDAKSAWPAK